MPKARFVCLSAFKTGLFDGLCKRKKTFFRGMFLVNRRSINRVTKLFS